MVIAASMEATAASAASGAVHKTLSSVPCGRVCAHRRGEPGLARRIDLGWMPSVPRVGEVVRFTAVLLGIPRGARVSWEVDGRPLAQTRGSVASVVFVLAGTHVVMVRARASTGQRGAAEPTRTARVAVSPAEMPMGCPETLPFNVLFGARDANGLPLNPEWAWQCDYQPPAGHFLSLTSPIAADFSAPEGPLRLNVSEYADPYELCKKFAYQNEDRTHLDIGPYCSSEISEWDAAQPGTWGWYEICHIELAFPPSWEEDNSVHGHVNFIPVTYTGRMQVKDFGGLGSDGDTNFKLYPDPSTAVQLGIPTIPGLTPANVESGPEALIEDASLHVEFATSEIRPALKDGYETWQEQLKAASYVVGEPQGTAVITGLLGLDDRHEAKAELHPVYAFAVREKPAPEGSDRWLVMFRNWGNEGGCSTHDALRHELLTPEGRITLALPAPSGPANSVRLGETHLSNTPDEAQIPITATLSSDHGRAEVTVRLPLPSERPVLAGEISLIWNGAARSQPQATYKLAPPPPTEVQRAPLETGKATEQEPDTLLVSLTKLLRSGERRRLEAILHGRPIATAPEAACQVLGPAAARAKREHVDAKEIELVHLVLMCPTVPRPTVRP